MCIIFVEIFKLALDLDDQYKEGIKGDCMRKAICKQRELSQMNSIQGKTYIGPLSEKLAHNPFLII
jgi:hypothetical protein